MLDSRAQSSDFQAATWFSCTFSVRLRRGNGQARLFCQWAVPLCHVAWSLRGLVAHARAARQYHTIVAHSSLLRSPSPARSVCACVSLGACFLSLPPPFFPLPFNTIITQSLMLFPLPRAMYASASLGACFLSLPPPFFPSLCTPHVRGSNPWPRALRGPGVLARCLRSKLRPRPPSIAIARRRNRILAYYGMHL